MGAHAFGHLTAAGAAARSALLSTGGAKFGGSGLDVKVGENECVVASKDNLKVLVASRADGSTGLSYSEAAELTATAPGVRAGRVQIVARHEAAP
jgi:hypothetical protein